MQIVRIAAVLLAVGISAVEALATQDIRAVRISSGIEVDGRLSESTWQTPGFTGFRMKRPIEGGTPTQRTEVWVAYDDAAVYVAARMHDTAPDSIIQVLGRRDYDVTADWFAFYVDPYHDKRTGNYFAVSAAGSLQDGTLYNDDWDDNSWDGVWEGSTSVDAEGWSAELRIPFSQLRFVKSERQVWGVNFRRSIGRNNERSMAVYTPNQESGFVSRFIELTGIDAIVPPQQIEVVPYITSRAEFLQHAPGDPFKSRSSLKPGIGGDLKIGLTSNLTLNATVNPDFGQVEVDPAVVNLSDMESYFQEKRPFFVEGSNVFEFGYGGANNFYGFNFGGPSFFYSRRVGRTPQGSIPFDAEFADYPIGSHILGAGKVTGKVADGWNIGMIHAVTDREVARAETSGVRVNNIEVEPLSYYGIARAQKDFNDGRQGLGALATYTRRFFQDVRLADAVNREAASGGIDGWVFLDDDRTYVVSGWSGFSTVRANQNQMLSLQTSSRHYFQRPDASYLSVDSGATTMTGFAGRFSLNKQKGPVLLNAAFGFIDPSFDVNDLGFMWRTDIINYHVVLGYRWTDPTPYYNNVRIQASFFESRDFGNRVTWRGYWSNGFVEFPNFWSISGGFTYNPQTTDTRSTRGGPAMLNPLGREMFMGIATDSRKPVVAEWSGWAYLGGGGEQGGADLSIVYKPTPNINLSVGPSWGRTRTDAQYVTTYGDPTATATYGMRYVFSVLEQTTIAANIRLNWTFTPQLSLQLFAQPLISSGKYTHLRAFSRPGSFDFMDFGTQGSTLTQDIDPQSGAVVGSIIDADGNGPAPTTYVGNPDFNYRSLRGNAVLRWEYRPGSAVYFVWTQSRSDSEVDGEFKFKRSFDRLLGADPDNIFMVKFSYWMNL